MSAVGDPRVPTCSFCFLCVLLVSAIFTVFVFVLLSLHQIVSINNSNDMVSGKIKLETGFMSFLTNTFSNYEVPVLLRNQQIMTDELLSHLKIRRSTDVDHTHQEQYLVWLLIS